MAGLKVLLVDDEEEFVRALAERLQIRGIQARVALNGEQGLQMVQDEAPDVMVLDLRMPGIDGAEVLRRVRKSSPEVGVIVLTGHGSEKDSQTVMRLGAFEYLQKPVDIVELVAALMRAYEAKKEAERSRSPVEHGQ